MVDNSSTTSVRTMQKPVIVVHDGVGLWRPERRKAGISGVEEAAKAGFEILQKGGTAINAVETAVICMEDNEIFNAGLGSAYSLDKRIKMKVLNFRCRRLLLAKYIE
jgi:beta-aspartyl-peptidase (threonine type)